MDSNLFILMSCFTLSYAGLSDIKSNEDLLRQTVDNHEDYLAEESIALQSLVPKEDVLKSWEKSHSLSGFGTSWLILPDGNGTAGVAILKSEDRLEAEFPFDPTRHSNAEEAYEKVKFILFTAEKPNGVNFTIQNFDKLEFPKKDGIKIICHGWKSNANSDIIQGIKNAYIAEQNVSVIGVDWSYGSNDIFYNACAKRTPHVGKVIADLINKLVERFDLRYENFHIIGHSLGAHIAGFAGRNTEFRVNRITGLDPALPGFQYLQIAGGRLKKTDANFVDIIHSCSSSLGMSVPIGHIDFYPNGGTPLQPGCVEVLIDGFPPGLSSLACSHARSYEFFEESVRSDSKFIAVQCDNWDKFMFHECSQNFTQMGDRVNRNSRGIYYLKTGSKSPYYLGINGTIF